MYKYILIVILLAGNFHSFGQRFNLPEGLNKKAVKYFEKGLAASKSRQYSEAIDFMSRALEKEPGFLQAKLVKGSAYLQLKEYSRAEEIFDDILANHPDRPDKSLYTIGLIKWKLDKFAEAYPYFESYIASPEPHDALLRKAKIYARNARFSAKAQEDPRIFEPKGLGSGINTPSNEYCARVTAKGDEMIFTRREGPREYFFISKFENGKWQPAEELTEINELMEAGAHTITPDGKMMIFTSCHRWDGLGNCDLYYSKKKDGKWSKPINMGRAVNSSAWDSQPAFANNGNTLYFSSNRQGTLGNKDIWVTHRDPETRRWSKPQNLGPQINTKKDDKSPYMHFDDRTLFFMSNGRPGMGDFDIYFAKKIDEDNWSKVTNLGAPVNTKFQEGTLAVSLDGTKGYITSDRKYSKELNREEYSNAETDVYEFVLDPVIRPTPATYVAFKVVDARTGNPISAELTIINDQNGQELYSDFTSTRGEKLLVMATEADYAIHVSKEGYVFHSERLELKGVRELTDPMEWRIELKKMEEVVEEKANNPVILKNVLFETGSAELKKSSHYELEVVLNMLKANENIHIEIRGHTDNVGRAEDNVILSQQRAETVKSYLVERGIDVGRITAKGYGEEIPIDTNDTFAGRKNNRRTEFVIK